MDVFELMDALAESLEKQADQHDDDGENRRVSAYGKGLSAGWCDGKRAAAQRIRDELAVARAYQAVKR